MMFQLVFSKIYFLKAFFKLAERSNSCPKAVIVAHVFLLNFHKKYKAYSGGSVVLLSEVTLSAVGTCAKLLI